VDIAEAQLPRSVDTEERGQWTLPKPSYMVLGLVHGSDTPWPGLS